MRLTAADRKTIRRALNDAISDRSSYADAWPANAPERAAALKLVERYEALHRKMFGEASHRRQVDEALANTPTTSIFELGKQHAIRQD